MTDRDGAAVCRAAERAERAVCVEQLRHLRRGLLGAQERTQDSPGLDSSIYVAMAGGVAMAIDTLEGDDDDA